jgi:hypothetical protein
VNESVAPLIERHATGLVTRTTPARASAALVLAVIAMLAGCGTMRSVNALRDVDFELDRVNDVRVAGMRIDGRHAAADVPPDEAAMLAAAALSGHLPLECEVVVRATNPPSNPVTAELVRMDWTLLLDGRKTVGGRVARRYTIPPGESADVPVHVSVDLFEMLGRQMPTLLRLAAALSGDGRSPVDASLQLNPYLDTPLGSMRFPHAITVPLGKVRR